jgi:hypothetical protein
MSDGGRGPLGRAEQFGDVPAADLIRLFSNKFGLLDEHALDEVHAWAAAGGPGLVPIPEVLTLHRISRPRISAGP